MFDNNHCPYPPVLVLGLDLQNGRAQSGALVDGLGVPRHLPLRGGEVPLDVHPDRGDVVAERCAAVTHLHADLRGER